MAQKYADIQLLDDPMELAASAGSADILVFDLDANQKLVEKTIKKIKKMSVNRPIVVITNNLASNDMAKHQKSKHGADIYLRAPVNEGLFLNMIRPYVGDLSSAEEEAHRQQARTIISEHQYTEDQEGQTEETRATNAQLDQAFRKAMGNDEEASLALEGIQEEELEEINLDEGDDGLLDLGEDDLPSEELNMSEDDSKKKEDAELELGGGLELDLGAEEELSLDSLDEGGHSELSLDEEGLELDGSEDSELSLEDEAPEEIGLGGEEEGISLDMEEDTPLELGEDTQAKELSADDGLELDEETGIEEISEELSLAGDDQLEYDDDNSKMFHLEAPVEDPEEVLSLSGEGASEEETDSESLSLEEELDLSGESAGLEDADLFGAANDEMTYEESPSEEIVELGPSADEFESPIEEGALFGSSEEALSADSLPDSPELDHDKKGEERAQEKAEEKSSAKANSETEPTCPRGTCSN